MFDTQPWDWIVCMLVSIPAVGLLISAFRSVFATDTGKEKKAKPTQQGHRHSANDSRLGRIEP